MCTAVYVLRDVPVGGHAIGSSTRFLFVSLHYVRSPNGENAQDKIGPR